MFIIRLYSILGMELKVSMVAGVSGGFLRARVCGGDGAGLAG